MSNAKSKQAKPKTGLARCMELASDRKGLVFLAAVLSSLAAIASFIPYIAIYFMIRSIIGVFPNLDQLDMGMVMNYGWLALTGIVANILLYFLAIFSSHMAAFGTLYELKVLFADHITKIPLGYHLTIGSGRLRKIMDENIESVEGFIAHQFPDFVASITAPIVMIIILLAVDWRFGLASLVGIILAFIAEFIGFGSGEMREHGQVSKSPGGNEQRFCGVCPGNVGCKGVQPDGIFVQKTQRGNHRLYGMGSQVFPGLAELYACLYHNHQ